MSRASVKALVVRVATVFRNVTMLEMSPCSVHLEAHRPLVALGIDSSSFEELAQNGVRREQFLVRLGGARRTLCAPEARTALAPAMREAVVGSEYPKIMRW